MKRTDYFTADVVNSNQKYCKKYFTSLSVCINDFMLLVLPLLGMTTYMFGRMILVLSGCPCCCLLKA